MLCHVLHNVTGGLGKVSSVKSEIIKVVWPRKTDGWNDILRMLLELKFKERDPRDHLEPDGRYSSYQEVETEHLEKEGETVGSIRMNQMMFGKE